MLRKNAWFPFRRRQPSERFSYWKMPKFECLMNAVSRTFSLVALPMRTLFGNRPLRDLRARARSVSDNPRSTLSRTIRDFQSGRQNGGPLLTAKASWER